MKTNELETFSTGATRSEMSVRWDLLPPGAMRQMAEVMDLGAKIHGSRNWEKGLGAEVCVNHCLDHVFAYQSGDQSENHLAHAAVNLCMALHSLETWPELNKENPPKFEREAGK